MIKRLLLLCAISGTMLGQNVYYEGNVTQPSTNVPSGAAAPIMTVPYAQVIVCGYPATGVPCTNTVTVYEDQAGTTPLIQPLAGDNLGKFKFWTAQGQQLAISVSTKGGTRYLDTYPLSLPGGGGGSGSPGGTNLQMQYNASGSFGGTPVVIDNTLDATNGSVRIPKMVNSNNITTPNSLAINGPRSTVVNYYANPYGTNYPFQIPAGNFYQSRRTTSLNDFYANRFERLALFNTCRYFLTDTGNLLCGPDAATAYQEIYTYSPMQLGGADNHKIIRNSLGDGVAYNLQMLSRGSAQGFDEGSEKRRVNVGFNFSAAFGTVTLGAVDATGHQQLSMGHDGNAYDQLGTSELLIDLTKKFSPAGNVTALNDPPVSTTPSFTSIVEQITVDATMKAALDAQFGTTWHYATIVSGADMKHYDGNCPSAVVSATWNNADGSIINPYNTDWDGTDSKTLTQCVTVSGDISTLTDGAGIGFWSRNPNAEYKKLIHKVDSTHIVVPLDFPHQPGEIISWGAGLGWGISSPKYNPATFLSSFAMIAREDAWQGFPLVGWDSANSKLYAYVNADTSGGEMKLAIFGGQTPAVSGIYTATVSSGVLTAVTSSNSGGNYGVNNSGGKAILVKFPPPHLTLGGTGTCSTPPTFGFTSGGQGGWIPTVATGGAGCPSDLTITPQATYANPAIFFPITRISNVEDPSTHTVTGWMKTDPLLTSWATGDTIKEVMPSDQYSTDYESQTYSPYVANSRRFGNARIDRIYWPQNGPGSGPIGIYNHTNDTPGSYYTGDASTGYRPTQDDPTKWMYGLGASPYWHNYDGYYFGIARLAMPPYAGVGTDDDGSLFDIYCNTNVDVNHGAYPCDRPVNPVRPKPYIFRDFSQPDRANTYIRSDANTGTVSIGPHIKEGNLTLCKTNGTDCPSISTFIFQFATGAFAPAADTQYFLGDTIGALLNNTVGYTVPSDCYVKKAIASVAWVSGTAASGNTVDSFFLVNGSVIDSWTASWNGSTRNVTIRTYSPTLVHAGDILQFSNFTPAPGVWTPPSQASETISVYCATP